MFSRFFQSRDFDIPDTPTNKVGQFSRLSGMSFREIRDHCLQNGTLFQDPDFPAGETSLGMPSRRGRYRWMRPKDINSNARFMSDGVSRFDVKQGELGDCWLAAGLVALCDNRSLMEKVVPLDQSFDQDYAGVFRFVFWQYGRWTEVIVDDYLPTLYGEPAFISSTDSSEFWSALLEKAYAKLHGSYGALEGGHAIEAMEDFTGGVCEWYELQDKAPSDLYSIIGKALERQSLLSCAIDARSSYELEAELNNGLIQGHAYTVNWVKELRLKTGRYVRLVRLRNPWGNDKEWKLAWSDRSSEWYMVDEYDKRDIDFSRSADGEFWMSYDDFIGSFSKLEICNLGPDALTEELAERCEKRWEMVHHESEWVRHVSAGGCPNYWKTSFCSNPQFTVEVEAPDEDDADKGTIIVALMQKQLRSVKKSTSKNVPIGYTVYRLEDPNQGLIDVPFIRRRGNPDLSSEFTNLREVSNRHKVAPGTYCIIPSTFEPGVEREFILRIYSEKKHLFKEVDEATRTLSDRHEYDEDSDRANSWQDDMSSDDDNDSEGLDDKPNQAMMGAMGRLHNLLAKREQEGPDLDEDDALEVLSNAMRRAADGPRAEKKILSAFGVISDYDLEIGAYKIKDIIMMAYGREFGLNNFDVEVCKSMVAMLDDDRTGKLNYRESRRLWKSLRKWSNIFRENDVDRKGYLRSYQLRQVIRSVGYVVSNQTFQTLVQRYGDPDGHLGFQEYLHCVVRLNNMFEVFEESGLNGTIELNLDQFIQTTMYS